MTRMKYIAALLAAVSILALLSSCVQSGQTMTISVACIADPSSIDGTGAIRLEKRSIPKVTGNVLYRRLIAEMQKPPSNAALSAVLNYGISLTEVTQEDGIVICVFSAGLEKLDAAVLERMLCAVTLTLCQKNDVEGVRIFSGSQELHEGILTPDLYVTDTDALRIETYELTLYYPNLEQTGLDNALCQVRLPANANIAEAVMETLLSGPVTDKGYVIRFIPEGTSVNSVRIDNGICYVDLSEDFLNENIAASDGTSLVVYAIVNSLTALQDVVSVQFLINGETRQSYIHPHFDQPITPRTPGTIIE
ncbi:MAG: GerMN domain-containing protein [Clostridiaceae bacterium]|nr:GerMN domain-containing protein [Clostridiaceae bacterium]